MIIDCRTWSTLPDLGKSQNRIVLVDGIRIPAVWYVDTDKGLVKTYALDGKTTTYVKSQGFVRSKFPADWEFEIGPTFVSRIFRGKVSLLPVA